MPEVDGLLRGAGKEERGVEGVPDHLVGQSEVSMRSRDPPPPITAHLVDGGDVGAIGHQEGRGELCGDKVDVPLLRTDQVDLQYSTVQYSTVQEGYRYRRGRWMSPSSVPIR